MKNVCIMAGARSSFVRVAPVIRAFMSAREQGAEICCQLVYTGCKDDPTLEDTLFEGLQIAKPDTYLGVDCENAIELMGKVMTEFDRYLRQHPTDVVIVDDDLASTMAAAIVTKKQGLGLVHIAAGTRSFDISVPKEINRLVIDGLSDVLFTSGFSNSTIANKEGIEHSKVYMVGNVLIDNIRSLHANMRRPSVMDEYALREGEYLVFTINRKVIIEDSEKLKALVHVVDAQAKKAGVPIVAPLRGKAHQEVAAMQTSILLVCPQDYLGFSYLMAHAKGVVTDSGNMAEEATFNGVPCITLNSYAEHIETVKIGTNELVGEDPVRLAEMMQKLLRGEWKKAEIPDHWDGHSAERIVQILLGEAFA